jgi:CBS domain-containing protein
MTMRVTDVMTRGVECVRPGVSLQEAARKMRDLDIGPLPVCGDGNRLVGMLTDRDITVRAVADGLDPKTARVQDVMTPDIIYVTEDQDVTEAARLMREHQIRRLVVLDNDKRLVGIVSLGDLAVDTHDEELAGATLEAVSEPAEPRR